MGKSGIGLWAINQVQHSYEEECRNLMIRQLIENLGALEPDFESEVEIVFGLRLAGSEIDLMAFLPEGIYIGDLKKVYGRLAGGINGSWYVEHSDHIEPLKRRENPYEQLRRYRSQVVREITAFEKRRHRGVLLIDRGRMPHDAVRAGLVQVPRLDLECSIREKWWYACGAGDWIPHLLRQQGDTKVDLVCAAEWLASIGCQRLGLEEGARKLHLLNRGRSAVRGGSPDAGETWEPKSGEIDSAQMAAVAHPCDSALAVVAGPGSGKTRVVVERTCRLLDNIPEGSWVGVVSYTNAAADEIRARVDAVSGDTKQNALFIGTFHSFAREVLRRAADDSKPGGILDERTSAWRYACCCGIEEKDARSELQTITRFPFSQLSEQVRGRWNAFLKHLKSHDVATFESLLHRLLEVVESHPEALPRALVYDEFQDVSPLQGELVKALANKGAWVTVVGDPEQSIYGFNGCSPDSLISFEEEVDDASTAKLEKNFRSHQDIVELCAMFRLMKGSTLEIQAASGVEEGGWEALRFKSDRRQASHIAEWIRQLRDAKKIELDEIAVLFRNRSSLGHLTAALEKSGIPYRLGGRGDSISRPMKELVALAMLESRMEDPEALFSLMEVSPKVSRGLVRQLLELERKAGALCLTNLARVQDQLNERHKKELSDFLLVTEKVRSAESLSPAEELKWLWSEVVQPGLSREEARRIETLDETLSAWCGYLELRPARSKGDVLDALAMLAETSSDEEAVYLGTIHSAKGREWRAVAVVDLCDDNFMRSTDDPEEEVRLFHVACSRAISWLLLAFPDRRGMTVDNGDFRAQFEKLAQTKIELHE